MTVYLLGYETSSLYPEDGPTAVRLARHAGLTFRRKLDSKDHYTKKDVLIRYGSDSYASYDKLFGTVLNRAHAISRSVDKLESWLVLAKNGIPMPEMWMDKDDIIYPAFRRLTKHSRGSDIRVMMEPDQFVRGDFYTQYIPSVREYRCNIFKNECIRLGLKYPAPDEESHPQIKSHNRGWYVTDIYKHWPAIETKVIEIAKKAVKVLGLDFGCCDVIVEDEMHNVFLLEVNTCPRLNKFGMELYSKAIAEELGLPTDNIVLGLVRDWKYKDKIPLKYRRCYHSKSERLKNEAGL